MARLRSGFAIPGTRGYYFAAILAWFDSNMSAVVRAPRYLIEEAPFASMSDVTPDPESFVLGVKQPTQEVDD